MYAKNIWNPADIITQERWNNIENNVEFNYAFYIPIEIDYSEYTENNETGTEPESEGPLL